MVQPRGMVLVAARAATIERGCVGCHTCASRSWEQPAECKGKHA
jgi:cbb3-type cytochrome oxidase cytochrome c subunit